MRIGSLSPRPIDVRFIAATHRDLNVLVVQGQFRQDLLFRLNGVTVRLPPLRDRVAEILPLAHAFLAEACAHAGKPRSELSPGASLLLEVYRWPGNVRELRNVIERAALVCNGPSVEVAHIVLDETLASAAVSAASSSVEAPAAEERQHILVALERCAGNQTEAAKLLGISRRQLRYRLDKLGVPRPRKNVPHD
jgi:DNA-binding NtrC family response regulator